MITKTDLQRGLYNRPCYTPVEFPYQGHIVGIVQDNFGALSASVDSKTLPKTFIVGGYQEILDYVKETINGEAAQ